MPQNIFNKITRTIVKLACTKMWLIKQHAPIRLQQK